MMSSIVDQTILGSCIGFSTAALDVISEKLLEPNRSDEKAVTGVGMLWRSELSEDEIWE